MYVHDIAMHARTSTSRQLSRRQGSHVDLLPVFQTNTRLSDTDSMELLFECI
jgi:hypothetical protein